MSCRCRPLIAAAAALMLAPAVAVAQAPASGTLAQSTIADPNAQFLQPALQGNPNNPSRFRRNGLDTQAPPTGSFTAPSRIGAIPTYGSPPRFGAGNTGFDAANLSKNRKARLRAQVVTPRPGVQTPQTTFDPLPTTQFAVPTPTRTQPATPPAAIYPSRAAGRPGASLPPVAQPPPVSNPPPVVYPATAASRQGAKLPVPQDIDAEENARAALYAPNASASTPPPGTPPPNSLPLGTVPSQPLPIGGSDPYAAVGIRGGSFLFFPSVELSAGADSNPQRASTNGPGSLYFVVAPELRVQSDWSRHSLTADIKGSYTDYTNGALQPSLNHPYFNSVIDGRIDVTRDTQFLLENRFLVSTANANNPNLQAGLAKLPIQTAVGGTAGLSQDLGRLNLTFKSTVDRYTVADSKLTDGETASNADQNYNQYGGILRGTYDINSEVKPFVELQADTRVHDNNADAFGNRRGSEGTSAKFGATLAMTNSLTGEMAVGYMQRIYHDPMLPLISGMTIDGALIWQATPLTTARITAASIVNESTLENVSGSLSRDVGVEVDHALRRWLIANIMAGYGNDNYVGLGRDDNRYYVASGLTYAFTRELSLKGELRHDWLRSNVADTSSDSTSVLFTLRLQR